MFILQKTINVIELFKTFFFFTSLEMSVPERSTDTKQGMFTIYSIPRSVKFSQFRKLK